MSYTYTKFFYDENALTDDQKSLIEEARIAHDETIKRLREEEDVRIQHYYDCVDDYSWGGLCSQVNAKEQSRADFLLEERIEEIVRGGYLVKTRKVNILRDIKTGESVAVGLHDGKFGPYFKTNEGKFVSYAKKVQTYEKKGYIPIVQTVVEKVKRDGFWSDGSPRYKHLGYVSITNEVSTERVY